MLLFVLAQTDVIKLKVDRELILPELFSELEEAETLAGSAH
jgi:hypothetical protein